MPRATETPVRIAMKDVMEAYGLDEYTAKPRIVPTMTNTLPSNDKMNAVKGRSSKECPHPPRRQRVLNRTVHIRKTPNADAHGASPPRTFKGRRSFGG